MPEYLYPGVYVEEVDTGNKPIEGVSTSTVGFLGIAERGPVTATYITSFTDFKRTFGGYYSDSNGNQAYLAHAVEGFFLNGGLRCWVARVTPLDTANNGKGAAQTASDSSNSIKINAAGPGAYGNQIGYLITSAGLNNPNLFKLVVYYWPSAKDATTAMDAFNTAVKNAKPDALPGILAGTPSPAPTQTEIFDNLSAATTSSTYYVGTINGGSNLVIVSAAQTGLPKFTNNIVLLSGGSDGKAALVQADFEGADADPAQTTTTPSGLNALSAVDDISLLCCPDEYNQPPGTIAGLLQTACENMKDRFAILQSAPPSAGIKPSAVTPSVNSKYAAFYYPWLNVIDPTSNATTLIPPGGHIAGIYARSDNEENVAKDPANEQILGIDSLQFPINNQLQAQLNPIGVNCLRYFKGQGNLVWGGRTTSPDPDWQYINVRRLFIFVEKSIQRGTQWVVFQNNDPATWARVVRSVSDFLTGLWMQDMLMGATKEQAFFVRCDQTTMTQTDIDSGRLIVLVGIAPVYPAEFVIFRIGQWAGGSSVAEG
jgi:phage tail sheath protein FI